MQGLLQGPHFDAPPIVFRFFVRLCNPGQPADGGSVLVADGDKLRDSVCQLTDLAVVRFYDGIRNAIRSSIVILPSFYGIVRIRCVEIGCRKTQGRRLGGASRFRPS